jgi:ankyrin repeat protein
MQAPTSSLHLAAEKQSEELVSLFLEHGVDINLRNESGHVPLHAALMSEQRSLKSLFFFSSMELIFQL